MSSQRTLKIKETLIHFAKTTFWDTVYIFFHQYLLKSYLGGGCLEKDALIDFTCLNQAKNSTSKPLN